MSVSAANKRTIDQVKSSGKDNENEKEDEESGDDEWVGPVPDIAESHHLESQKEDKEDENTKAKRRRSKLRFLFIFQIKFE